MHICTQQHPLSAAAMAAIVIFWWNFSQTCRVIFWMDLFVSSTNLSNHPIPQIIRAAIADAVSAVVGCRPWVVCWICVGSRPFQYSTRLRSCWR